MIYVTAGLPSNSIGHAACSGSHQSAQSQCKRERKLETEESRAYQLMYDGCSSQTRTFNFTGIKRGASVAVLHAIVSGKCVLLLIGGAHVAGQSRDC